jgi:hypothetical protein
VSGARRAGARPPVPALLLCAALLAAALLSACAQPGAAEVVPIKQPLPAQESLHYRLLDPNGRQMGSALVSIRSENGALVLSQNYTDDQNHTDAGSVTVDPASMRPQSAHRDVNTADVHSTLDVTYRGDSVTAVAHDAATGKEQRHLAKITASSYDDQESFFLLRTLDFTAGYSVRFGVVVVDVTTGTISRALGTARVLGTTDIQLNGATHHAWEVQLSGAGVTNTAWYDSDAARTLLRYTSGRGSTIELMPQ